VTDQIHIKDLLLRTVIGINAEERRDRQDVLINITLDADLRAAGRSDDIQDAVNYRSITKRIIQLVEQSQFYLVEKLAAEIAALCLADPRVASARVTVEKPGALRFARSVGVTVVRSHAEQVFVVLGSNIDADHNLRRAVKMLAEHCRLLAVSPVYETLPVGKTDQPNFLNAAALIETDRPPEDLKSGVLQPIERALGRRRSADKNAPRTIDLDIALYGARVVELGPRHVPDPDILHYAHLARPLADLAPTLQHPETGETLHEIALRLAEGGLTPRPDIDLRPG
jgi:dihydroneopterin aldolase / 2-amino-4-hydroxy-6-hydroxymethyldihydropteridine diphosphokinase